MDFLPTQTAPGSSAIASAAGATENRAAAVLSSDFETFLKMLTAQMQNQDPLNPVESSDYAVQLATFSSVEQQVLTNDLLRDLAGAMGGTGLQQAASWIGMEALVRAPVSFDGTPVALRPDYADGAESARLLVRDGAGTVVQRLPLDMTDASMLWSGVDDTGMPFPTGTYRFEIESYRNGNLVDTRVAQAYNQVTEVRADAGAVLVRLSDGTEIESSLISGLRTPTR